MVAIENFKINHTKEAIGVELPLFLSWNLFSDERGCVQNSWKIIVSEDEDFSSSVFENFQLSSLSAEIELLFDKAKSFTKYYVKLEVQTSSKAVVQATSFFVTGQLSKDDWKGCFVTGDESYQKYEYRNICIKNECKARQVSRDNNKKDIDYKHSVAHFLEKDFSIEKAIKSAYVAASALGLYELYINDNRVGNAVFTPGWTSYDNRVQYQVYNVKDLLLEGKNTVQIHVGTGWYKGELAFYADCNVYGKRTAAFLNLIVEYSDGDKEVIATDENWSYKKSPLLFTEIYHGEIYDARLENETATKKVEKVDFDLSKLVSQVACFVTTHERFPALSIIKTPKEETVIDFGQNLSGFVEFRIKAEEGTELSFRCFEELDYNGNAYYKNLRRAQQRIKYICKSNEEEVYHSHFSPQGFRYIVLEKWYGEPSLNQFTAIAVYSDMEKTGSFECSSPLINQLQHNIEWGMKSNFLDIPTDCPQRNERLGWTGDAQIFCSTASFLCDTEIFFTKWLKDLALDQYPNGEVPHVVPDCITKIGGCNDNKSTGSAAWADAAVINTWNVYLVYGSLQVIRNQFASMKAFVDWMYKCTLFDSWPNRQYGDWLALDAKAGSYKGATPDELVCYAYEYYSTKLFSIMCDAINERVFAAKYKKISEEVKKIFINKFFQSSGRMKIQTQTAHILALHFGLVPEGKKARVVKDLIKLLKNRNGHIATGFVGTPYFLFALSENNHEKEAYELLLKEDFPSWLYQVKMGATTVWEHWDGKREDGSMWSEDMNSFNHYAYGSVGDWLYKACAGLIPDENNPGYKHFFVSPCINDALSYAKLSYKSIYGKISIYWKKAADMVTLSLEVPANTSATIILKNCSELLESDSLKFISDDRDNKVVCAECPSGIYKINYKIGD